MNSYIEELEQVTSKKTTYDVATSMFTALLSKGIIPWDREHIICSNGERYGAYSHSFGKDYSLLNQMLLEPGEYISFKGANAAGGRIKKGSKSVVLFGYKMLETTERNKDTNRLEKKKIPYFQYSRVFKMDDVEDIKIKFIPDENDVVNKGKYKFADKVIFDYLERLHTKVVRASEIKVDGATNTIYLPEKPKKTASYYHDVFKSLAYIEQKAQPTSMHSIYDLVSEIVASYFMQVMELKYLRNPNSDYAEKWCRALDDDHHLIVRAASRATKAIHSIRNEEE